MRILVQFYFETHGRPHRERTTWLSEVRATFITKAQARYASFFDVLQIDAVFPFISFRNSEIFFHFISFFDVSKKFNVDCLKLNFIIEI